MPTEKHLCSACATGEKTYLMDKQSEHCPYLLCLKGGKCPVFKPIAKDKPFLTKNAE